MTVCSKNFQNVKLRPDFVQIWSFYCYSEFTWNQILVHSNGSKMSFLAILDILNFDFSKFEQLSSPKCTKNSKFWVSEIAKNDIFRPFECTKIWFHVKLEWRFNYQILTKSSLNFKFWNWNIVDGLVNSQNISKYMKITIHRNHISCKWWLVKSQLRSIHANFSIHY